MFKWLAESQYIVSQMSKSILTSQTLHILPLQDHLPPATTNHFVQVLSVSATALEVHGLLQNRFSMHSHLKINKQKQSSKDVTVANKWLNQQREN